jgi:hypothetical protein
VLNDEPTLPNLPDDMPTLLDLRRLPPVRPPDWPLPAERGKQPIRRRRSSFGWMHVAALGAGAALLLSLLSMVGLISLTGHAGFSSSPRTSATQPSPDTSATDPTPTHGPSAVPDWLQIAPTDVQLGCADHQRTQTVVLANRGSRQVHWQASLVNPAGQPAVSVSPGNGDLGPGESTAIQLQSAPNSADQREVIRFAPSDPEAGSPASLTVTAVGCN